MHITRVLLSFFSIGFLAGSFEQAAGLGPAQRRQPAPTYELELATLTLPPATGLAAPSLDGQPRAGGEPAPDPQSAASPPKPLTEAGDAKMAEWVEAWSRGRDAKAEPVALHQPAPASAPASAHTLRPFFDPLPPQADGLVAPEPRPAKRPPQFILPIARGRVTSLFNQGRRHPAIDLAGPLGSPVYATTRQQRVTFAGWRGGYGNLVITTDPQGRQHYYGHLHRILARVGTVLDQGQTLGLLGSTGRSTGPHVHYEVRTSRWGNLDPSKLLFAGLKVRRGYAWHMPQPAGAGTEWAGKPGPKLAARGK
jgi:murein DD-endopeptidase MepM/ murein hydrolase activator NlpD